MTNLIDNTAVATDDGYVTVLHSDEPRLVYSGTKTEARAVAKFLNESENVLRAAYDSQSKKTDNTAMLYRLARGFQARAQGLGYKGKKRDDAALEYVCGAAMALSGDDGLTSPLSGALFILSVRGYREIEKWIADFAPKV